MPLLHIYATAHPPTGQPTFRHAVLRLHGQPQMVIQLHHRPFVIRLDFYIARCSCIIQRNHNGGEKILINLQKNIVDQQIVLTQLLHLSPLLLLLLCLVAINCPTSAFTLFYNLACFSIDNLLSFFASCNTFLVKESPPIPTLYLSLLPFPPLGWQMNTSEVEMMNLHNYLPPPQYVPPQGLLARTHEG